MNNLTQLECYKLACVFLTSPDIIIVIRQLYSASEIVTKLLGQLKIDAGLVSQEWRPALRGNLHRLCIDDIFFIKIFYHNTLKSCPLSRQISNCNVRIIGYWFFDRLLL